MNRLLAWTLAAALWPVAGLAMPATELEPSVVRACLLPTEGERGVPDYPFELYKRQIGGRVKATVTFPGGLFGPSVEIDAQQGDEGFAKPVREYLRKLSAPCVPAGTSARLQFDFQFTPNDDRARVGGIVDLDDLAAQRMRGCLAHVDKLPQPPYPRVRPHEANQGRVLATLTFRNAQDAPTIRLLHRTSAASLAAAAERWAAGLRVPCFEGNRPLVLIQTYVFVMEGDSYGFKPIALTGLMRMTKDIQRQRIQWDTREMGCPFQLKFQYLQPQARNHVTEPGPAYARRKPLLEWLAQAEIVAKSDLLDAIFADTADVTVPCARFDLNPKE